MRYEINKRKWTVELTDQECDIILANAEKHREVNGKRHAKIATFLREAALQWTPPTTSALHRAEPQQVAEVA